VYGATYLYLVHAKPGSFIKKQGEAIQDVSKILLVLPSYCSQILQILFNTKDTQAYFIHLLKYHLLCNKETKTGLYENWFTKVHNEHPEMLTAVIALMP